MLNENVIVYFFILKPKWNYYFPNIKSVEGQFAKYQDKKYIIDDDYLYFYSRDEFNLENQNVGRLSDKLKVYRLPIDKKIVQVLRAAKKIEDLRLLYNPDVIQKLRKDYNKVESLKLPFKILSGEADLDQELQNAIIDENYEEAAVIRDILNTNFLKNLFTETTWK